MYLQKISKAGLRFIAFTLVVLMISGMTIGCANKSGTETQPDQNAPQQEQTKETSEKGLHRLTQEDVTEIFQSGVAGIYQDKTMKEAVKAAGPEEVVLTEEEKQKIREMKLEIAVETNHMDDAFKWQLGGLKDTAKDLGITKKDVWMASDTSNSSQLEDYQRIESIAQNYDAIFTLPMDVAATSKILKKIMEKTTLVTLCSAPYDIDWKHPNFGGIVDADGYLAGVYSAKAAIKILNGQGKLGVVGFVGGKEGSFHTVQERYRGWNDVFKENPDVEIVQKWFDDPSKAGDVVSSMLASNPDIKTVLIDWANPPANQAETIFKQRGMKPGKDIAMVTIDLDNTIVVPMAINGTESYTAAFATQTWYHVGKLWGEIYAKHLLYGDKAPKYIVSPPLPMTTWENLKTHYVKALLFTANIKKDWFSDGFHENQSFFIYFLHHK
jgi:ABC-type sugar transport system substrate-binding protein